MKSRRVFIGSIISGLIPILGYSIYGRFFMNIKSQSKMPVFFFGHGSPMNAIERNQYTETLREIAKKIPTPNAILCVSAHWETNGTWVTSMESPKTIHDFYGFPKELFDIQYPAPGNFSLAKNISEIISNPKINLDANEWGLDHGTWSVLRHLYPDANIPVLQLSLDKRKPMSFHFELGKELSYLREKGVLIIGSGNLVHNLQKIDWSPNVKPHDWAQEFDDWIKNKITSRDFNSILNESLNLPSGKLSHPTAEHFHPLLYILGSSTNEDTLKFEYEDIQHASISMRSLSFT